MWSILLARLLALVAASSFMVLPAVLAEPVPGGGSLILHPLKPAVGGSKRARSAVDFSTLSLADKTRLLYGTPGEDGQTHFADMTLYAPNDLLIISMEVFEGLTSAVDCHGDDGTLSLTFRSREALDYALEKWSWINEDADKVFIMIANHDGCGPDRERQAYTISEVEQVDGSLTTLLKAKATPWDEVAGTWDLAFGVHQAPKLTRRGLRRRWNPIDAALDAVEGAADAVGDAVGAMADAFADLGDADVNKAVTAQIDVGAAGKRTNIITDTTDPPRWTVDCVDCWLKGSIQVTGTLSIENFVPKTVTLDASPNNLKANLEFEASFRKAYRLPLNTTRELFSKPIPRLGYEIPNIFKVGAFLQVLAGVDITITGQGNFTLGMGASLPNSANINLNVVDPGRSSQTDMSVDFDPKFEVNSFNGSVGGAAFLHWKLLFGFDIVKVGRMEAFLGVKLPQISLEAKYVYDEKDACPNEPGATKHGAALETKIGAYLNAGAEKVWGSPRVNPLPIWGKEIWKWEHTLVDKCYPFGDTIPEEKPATSRQSEPSAPATRVPTPSPSPRPAPAVPAPDRLRPSPTPSVADSPPVRPSRIPAPPAGTSTTRTALPSGRGRNIPI